MTPNPIRLTSKRAKSGGAPTNLVSPIRWRLCIIRGAMNTPEAAVQPGACRTANSALLAWVEKTRALCQPDAVYWCDGSQEEYDRICEQMVASGTFKRL